MTTLTVGVSLAVAVASDAATSEVIDARTELGTEKTVDVSVETQGRLPMILCP
jgi:hypothetical protein